MIVVILVFFKGDILHERLILLSFFIGLSVTVWSQSEKRNASKTVSFFVQTTETLSF